MRRIDVKIMDYMMGKKARLGTEKTKISELEKSLNLPKKKTKRALKRLEKIFIQIIK